MGKIIAIACAGLIVAGGATMGLYSYGAFCGGHDHGCCEVVSHDCCGPSGCCPSDEDAAQSAAIAVAGPAAAIPATTPISTVVPFCCGTKSAPVKAACCEDDCCNESGAGLNAVVGVAATTKK